MKVFYIKINDNDITGIDAISLVDMPAVERNFLCFSKDNKPVKMQFDTFPQKIQKEAQGG